jgi:hypothetical protein
MQLKKELAKQSLITFLIIGAVITTQGCSDDNTNGITGDGTALVCGETGVIHSIDEDPDSGVRSTSTAARLALRRISLNPPKPTRNVAKRPKQRWRQKWAGMPTMAAAGKRKVSAVAVAIQMARSKARSIGVLAYFLKKARPVATTKP